MKEDIDSLDMAAGGCWHEIVDGADEWVCKMTDEQLLAALRKGESEITDFIMEKYKYLVRKKAKAMFLLGGENDDLIQEGMIGLFKAVRDYDPELKLFCPALRALYFEADVQRD